MPYGMSDADYAREVDRKRAAGISLTASFDKAAYDRGKAQLSKSSSSSSSSRSSSSSSSRSSSSYWNRYGGYDAYVKSQQQRYLDAVSRGDTDLISRLQSDAARVGYSLPSYSLPSVSSTSSTVVKEKPKVEERLYDLINGLGNYSFPYEQTLRDIIGSAPEYTPISESEMRSRASNWAELQTAPLLEALNTRLANARTSAQNAQEKIRAQYANLDQWLNQALEEAGRTALEDAIARGMGRSGVVNWERSQLEKPLLMQYQDQKAQEAASIAEILNNLANEENLIREAQQSAMNQKGKLEAQRLAELQDLNRQLEQASRSGMWSMAHQLAQLANSSNAYQQSLMVDMLPWLTLTRGDLTGMFGKM